MYGTTIVEWESKGEYAGMARDGNLSECQLAVLKYFYIF